MARGKKPAALKVYSASGLNLRQFPALNAPVLRILKDGEEIGVDKTIDAGDGWIAVRGGGYVMAKYVK